MARSVQDAALAAANKFIDNTANVTSSPTGTLSVGEPLWTTSDLSSARINASLLGDTTLVAATAGQTTRVHRLKISPAGAVVIQIKDGTTVLETFNFAGADRLVLDFSSRPWYKTTANTALVINLSGAVQVDGLVEYVTSA